MSILLDCLVYNSTESTSCLKFYSEHYSENHFIALELKEEHALSHSHSAHLNNWLNFYAINLPSVCDCVDIQNNSTLMSTETS